MIGSSFVPVLLHVLAQSDLDFVGCSPVLLVKCLLLLLVREQDVGTLVASTSLEPGLRLLVMAFAVLDVLAGKRSGVLRLRELLSILRKSQLLLILHWEATSFVQFMLYLVGVLALNHHFLIDEELWVIVHEATSGLVIIRVLHEDCVKILALVRLSRGTLLIHVGSRHFLAVLHGQAANNSSRSELQ